MKYNVFVLCGGKSVEHDVSLESAKAIINSMDKDKYNAYPVYISNEGIWNVLDGPVEKIEKSDDLRQNSNKNISQSMAEFLEVLGSYDDVIIFPALHGPNGEDGTVQGLFELLDVPYVGCGVLSSAVAMDKIVARDLFKESGIPQTKYYGFNKHEWNNNKEEICDTIEKDLGYNLYIKPANSGSSVGINRATNRGELIDAINYALNYDHKIIVEKELIAREMQISVIGNNEPRVSLPGEYIAENQFLDYETKYHSDTTEPVLPARLDDKTTKKVMELAKKSYKVLNCKGLARIDIFVDENNDAFVNEANTLPGFTPISMTPLIWETTDGITYPDLIEILINYGLERYKENKEIQNMR